MSERTYRFGEDTINADEAIKVEDVLPSSIMIASAFSRAG